LFANKRFLAPRCRTLCLVVVLVLLVYLVAPPLQPEQLRRVADAFGEFCDGQRNFIGTRFVLTTDQKTSMGNRDSRERGEEIPWTGKVKLSSSDLERWANLSIR
jgi:hypothetical protein